MDKPIKTRPAKGAGVRGREGSRATTESHAGGLRAGEKPIRKNYYLYQSKIDFAKEILGTRSETAAVDAVLDMFIYGEALAQGTEEMVGEEYHDLLGIIREIPRPTEGE